MIGRGSLHVSAAQQLAASATEEIEAEGVVIPALKALGSLGGGHSGNTERDLHRWLRGLYGLNLQPYKLKCQLKASGVAKEKLCWWMFLATRPSKLCFPFPKCPNAQMEISIVRRPQNKLESLL